jgi:S-adenosylmethionine:tRNA-ribosyltransferase-isomerase (queuine synthetase)
MRVADFAFELPESLIAHYPQAQRLNNWLRRCDSAYNAP